MMSLNEIDWNDENELDFYDISCYDPIRRLLKLRKFIKFEILKNDDLFNKVDILG